MILTIHDTQIVFNWRSLLLWAMFLSGAAVWAGVIYTAWRLLW